jgi:hypothetical protein
VSEAARTAYRRFATFFLVVGAVFLVLALLRATLLPDVLGGDPTRVALLLLAIGGGLRWTVRRRPGEPALEEPLTDDPCADVPPSDADGDRRG